MNKKKKFSIDFDVTMRGSVGIAAENREKAERKFRERIKETPYYYAKVAADFVDYDIVDINENEE